MFYIDDENVGHDDVFVKSMDCDCFYKARPSFYFGLNQELGGLHAKEKGCGLKKIFDEEKKTWMIIRTRMEISKMADWTDTLSLSTWCQEGYRLYGPRFINCIDKKTGENVFTSGSWWIVMDLERKRPCKPNCFEDRLPYADKTKHYIDPTFPPHPSVDEFSDKRLDDWNVEINYYDTDYNRHVNNISYVNWILDAFPKSFLDEYRPTLIDAKWEKQSFLTDNLVVETFKKANSQSFLSRIIRKTDNDDQIVFQSLTEWTRKTSE